MTTATLTINEKAIAELQKEVTRAEKVVTGLKAKFEADPLYFLIWYQNDMASAIHKVNYYSFAIKWINEKDIDKAISKFTFDLMSRCKGKPESTIGQIETNVIATLIELLEDLKQYS